MARRLSLRLNRPVGLFCSIVLGFMVCLGAVSLSPAQEPATDAPPTSQPRLPTHAELVAAASARPLITPEYRKPDGSELSGTEAEELRKVERLVASAIALRRDGQYAKARDEMKQALPIAQKLLGPTQHMFVTVVSASASIDMRLGAPPDEKARLIESDKQEKLAIEAIKGGLYAEARSAARSAIEIREKLFGKEHPELIEPLRILGNALTELRALEEATTVLARALELSERAYGKAHPQTALVLDRIGWLQIYQSKNEDAAASLRRALFILSSTVGENAETAETMDNLGTALGASRSDFIEAVNHKLRALVIREKVLGPRSKDTAISLSNLAWLYARSGLRDEVIPLRKRALEIFEETLGPKHRDTLVEKSNLAQSYRGLGQLEEALQAYQSMVEMDEGIDAALEQGAINRLMMVGMLQLETGKQLDGEKTLRLAFEKAVRFHEVGEHGAAINELDQIALAYQSRRMLEDAVLVREKIQQFDDARADRTNELAIRRSVQLGRIYPEVGRAKDGVRVLERTVKLARAYYGDGEREMTGPLLALAYAQLEAGDLSDASRTCTEVMRIVEEKFSRSALNAAYALHTLGKVQMAQKNFAVAQFSLEEAREIIEKSQMDDPVKYVALMRDLSVCHLEGDEPQKAVQIMRDAMETCRKMKSPYPMQLKTMQTNTLKYLIDAMVKDSSADRAERDKLLDELKQRLQELRDARALTADMKTWMQELGLPVTRG